MKTLVISLSLLLTGPIKNTSSRQAYKKIGVTVDYLNKEGKRLNTEELMVIKTVKPGETA